MSRARFTRWATLAVAATALGATLAVLPAFGSQEVVRLHFAADGSSVAFSYNGTSQPLIPTTRCEISTGSSAGPLITLTSNRKLGLNSNGIGVKTGGSQGTPCGRADTTETVTLAIPTAGVLEGRTITKMVLDLELKGNAWVEVQLLRGGNTIGGPFGLQTGSSIQSGLTPLPGPPYLATSTATQPVAACASPSDSGPDSGANDNCLWTIDPGSEFDTATFTVRVGEFSLEGSGDFGGNSDYDSLFYLSVNESPVANDDEVETNRDTPVTIAVLDNDTDANGDALSVASFTQGTKGSVGQSGSSLVYTPNAGALGPDTFTYVVSDGRGGTDTGSISVEIFDVICSTDTVDDEDGDVSGSFTRIGDGLDCKRYTLEADGTAGTVLFRPLGGGADVPYGGYLTLGSTEPPASGASVNLFLEYDPTGGDSFQPVPWCESPVFDISGDVTTAIVPGYPEGPDTWCIASAYTRGVGTELVTTWQVFGFDDPKFQ
jgi:hypothetical protein